MPVLSAGLVSWHVWVGQAAGGRSVKRMSAWVTPRSSHAISRLSWPPNLHSYRRVKVSVRRLVGFASGYSATYMVGMGPPWVCVVVGSTAVARVEPWSRALVRKWCVAVWGGSYIEFVSRCDHKLSITDR